jgi:hypothetical protein
MRKTHDIVIYSDDKFYTAFPSVVTRPDGEMLLAFRRAPDRRRIFAAHCTHCDPNSYLVLIRSADGGHTWTSEPELIYAHPLGGSQDPCMVQLDDNSLLVTSYAWMLLPDTGIAHCTTDFNPQAYGWTFTFLGGYLMRSTDGGHSWRGPIVPPQIPDESTFFPGIPIPAMNRGAMVQGRDGNLYWAVARSPRENLHQTALDLMISRDRGLTWDHGGGIAADKEVVFNETSLIETPGGDLVAFARTSNFHDHGVVVRSSDQGKTWQPWQDMGIVGHPFHALRLPDNRVFLLYGYRHEPYGIRARVLDPECRDFSGEEIVLRDDGGNSDLGYPWACLTPDGRILAVYYFNQQDGTRQIAGTFLEIE